jgi:hypothetical protein
VIQKKRWWTCGKIELTLLNGLMIQFLNKSIVEAEDFKRQKISDGNVSQGGEITSDLYGSAQSAIDEASGGSDDEVLRGDLNNDGNHLSSYLQSYIYHGNSIT